MSENKDSEKYNNISNENKNKNIDFIKVNIKIFKGNSPKGNNNILLNKSNSKTKINLSDANKNLLLHMNMKLKKKTEEKKNNNLKKIQKKLLFKEKFHFFIKKITKIFLIKIFELLKEKYGKNKYKRNINKKNKSKLKLSSKEKSKTKNKDNRSTNMTNNNNNLFKQALKMKNSSKKLGNIGLKRPPSQKSKKNLDTNINISNHLNIQQKQRSVKMKTNKNSKLNNSKSKKNKYINKIDKDKIIDNINLNSKIKKLKKDNYISQNILSDIKYNNSINEIKSNNIQLKENNNLIKNNIEEGLVKPLNNNIKLTNIENEDIHYYNTEISSNLIKKKYNINNSPNIYRVYENNLFEGNKYFKTKFENIQNNKKNLIYPSSPEVNNFLSKNISLIKTNINKNSEKIFNIKIKSFNNLLKTEEQNLYFQRCETNPINKNLNDLFKISIIIKNIFDFWKCYSEKKNILSRILNRNKIFKIIKESQSIIFKILLKLLKSCKLSTYFKKYKDIYYRKKILQNIKNKEIKCINIPIMHKNGYDIINNININNYINYSDFNKFMKKRAQSPIILSKLMMFEKENNNNYNSKYIKYNGNIFDDENNNRININNSYNLQNNYDDNFISFSATDRFYYVNNYNYNSDKNLTTKFKDTKIININGININKDNFLLNRKYSNYYNNQNNINYNKEQSDNIFNNNAHSEIIPKKITIVDQVNQLRMVMNLLYQNKDKNVTLYEYFQKWLYETRINNKINNKSLFWSFSGNSVYNIKDDNNNLYNKYSINTYKEKNMNNEYSDKKTKIEIGKYTPVRGIKNFRSKTSQKMENNQKIFDYNNINEINYKNNDINYKILNQKYSSLMNINNMKKNDISLVYHKKKLYIPNLISNNNCFLDNNNMNNNSYLVNLGNYKPMNLTSLYFYKNVIKNKNNNYSNINISQINSSFNSFNNDNNNNNGNLFINHYKSCTQIKSNLIQEKNIDLRKLNKIEEKEINFSSYKRNNSYNKESKINQKYNNNSNEENKKNINEDNIKIIYKNQKQFNNFNNYNKKIRIYKNSKIKIEKNNVKYKNYLVKTSKANKSAIYSNIYYLNNEFKNDEKKNIINLTFSYFEKKCKI